VVVEHSGALIKTPCVPRPPKSKALAVEMMAELVTKGAEKRAVRGDLFTDGGPHPKTYEHGLPVRFANTEEQNHAEKGAY